MKVERRIKILGVIATLAAPAGLLFPAPASSQSGPEANAAQAVECTLRPRAEVSEKVVRLSHLARCQGGPAALRRLILGTVVGRAPGPGQRLQLDPDWLLVKVRRRGVNRSQVIWRAPKNVVVTTAFQQVEGRAFEKAFREYVLNQMPWSPENVRIEKVRTRGQVYVPAGRVRLEVEPPKKARLLGRVSLGVRIFVGDRPIRRVWVTGEIHVRTEVWILERPVRRGHLFTPTDLRPVEVSLRSVPAGVIEGAREVAGMRARRAIAARTPIRKHWLERVPLMKRGDVVNLKAESKTLLITTIGVVRSDGALGDMVQVLNLGSKKLVYGRVLDARTVQVLF